MSEQRYQGDQLRPEDIQLPEMKLIQNVGGDDAKVFDAKAGDFFCAVTGEVFPGEKGFDMIVMGMKATRTYWGRTEITEDPPLCASMDANKSMEGKDCLKCEFRTDVPWSLDRDERRKKCLINYNIIGLLYAEKEGLPILLRASGISAGKAKELYSRLIFNPTLKKAWYKAKTHVTSMKKKTAAGEAYALNFGKMDLITDEARQKELGEVSTQLLGVSVNLIPETTESSEGKPDINF